MSDLFEYLIEKQLNCYFLAAPKLAAASPVKFLQLIKLDEFQK